MFAFHNSRGPSNIDLSITNDNVIADVYGWEISAEESCSDHNYLKSKIGTANRFKNQGIRYMVKEDKYHEFDHKLVQETLKIFKNKLQRKCRRNRHELIYNSITRKRFGEVRRDIYRGNAISIYENLENYKRREQDKTE